MNPLILIAEDDADIRGLLKLYLEGEGFRVLEADNGARAWSWPEPSPRTWLFWIS